RDRVLALLAILPDTTIRQAIEGTTSWLSGWEKALWQTPEMAAKVWLRIWPIAVAATNSQSESVANDSSDPSHLKALSDESEPEDFDTLNTPVGRMVGVFLKGCPTVHPGDRPFDTNETLRLMRSQMMGASGLASRTVKYRLV